MKWKVFMMYFRAIGMAASAIILAIFIVFQVSSVGANIWLSIWTNDKELANISLANTTEYQNRNYMFLGIYAAFGVVQGNYLNATEFNYENLNRSEDIHHWCFTDLHTKCNKPKRFKKKPKKFSDSNVMISEAVSLALF